MAETDGDVMADNVLATGALFASLRSGPPPGMEVTVDVVDGIATNALLVRFDFLKSQYRLTVEQVPGTEVDRD